MPIFGSGVSAVYQFQSAFSTFPAAGTWYPLSAYERSDGETKPREIDPLLGRQGYNKRDPEASAPALPQGGGQIQAPVCLREIGFWLTACFGAPVTTGVGPYTHVWESGKDALVYLAQSKKLSNTWYERARGLCVNTLAFNLQKEAGYPRATLGMLLRDTVKDTVEATGTIASPFSLLRVPAARPFVKRNAVAAPTTAFTFNYSNQLERYDPLNGTEYPDAFDPGDSQVSGSFTVRLEDATFDDLAEAETKQPWEFGWLLDDGLGVGSDASLTIALNNLAIDKSPKSIAGRGRLFHTYNWTAEQDVDSPAVTVTLVNDVGGYPPP
jgi:hypothetical protein